MTILLVCGRITLMVTNGHSRGRKTSTNITWAIFPTLVFFFFNQGGDPLSLCQCFYQCKKLCWSEATSPSTGGMPRCWLDIQHHKKAGTPTWVKHAQAHSVGRKHSRHYGIDTYTALLIIYYNTPPSYYLPLIRGWVTEAERPTPPSPQPLGLAPLVESHGVPRAVKKLTVISRL